MDAIVALAPAAGRAPLRRPRARAARARRRTRSTRCWSSSAASSATSCGSRAATRSSPRAAARRRARCAPPASRSASSPGVSAALAAPAAAGIPLMLRQLTRDGHVRRRQRRPRARRAARLGRRSPRLGGTLVILTGRGRIRRIAARADRRRPRPATRRSRPSAPAARAEQRVLRGTLADLPAPLPPPVTFVVGAVAALDLTTPGGAAMHIPDGFLTGEAAALGTAPRVGGPRACACAARARAARERDLPVAGLAAAFFLVGDAPLFPVTVGTQGHLLGGALAVALLGPWLGALTIAVVCVDPGARARRRRDHDARARRSSTSRSSPRSSATRCCSRCGACCSPTPRGLAAGADRRVGLRDARGGVFAAEFDARRRAWRSTARAIAAVDARRLRA